MPVHFEMRSKDKLRPALEVLLINVQPPLPTLELMLDGRPSDVRRLAEPLNAQGAKLLAAAQQALEQAGIEHRSFVEIGDPATLIAGHAKTYHCELIVMEGARLACRCRLGAGGGGDEGAAPDTGTGHLRALSSCKHGQREIRVMP